MLPAMVLQNIAGFEMGGLAIGCMSRSRGTNTRQLRQERTHAHSCSLGAWERCTKCGKFSARCSCNLSDFTLRRVVTPCDLQLYGSINCRDALALGLPWWQLSEPQRCRIANNKRAEWGFRLRSDCGAPARSPVSHDSDVNCWHRASRNDQITKVETCSKMK